MKKCKQCGKDKDISDFPVRKDKLKSGEIVFRTRHSCKECFNQYFRVYFKGNKIHQSRVLKNKADFRRKISLDKIAKGCMLCKYNKCGQSLHYHHLDRKTKRFGIANLTSNLVKQDKLEEELSKCIVLCANCHGEVEAGLVEL